MEKMTLPNETDCRVPGLIGGMSWESTVLYYQWINQSYKSARGGLHSAPLYLHSVDFAVVEALQHAGNWRAAGEMLAAAAVSLERAGADFLVICTNTMHKVADQVSAAVALPLLHIVDPTASTIKQQGIDRIGLLGTGFTMSDDFYTGRMREQGIEVVLPDAGQQAEIHRIIYSELCQGEISAASRDIYLAVIRQLKEQGAAGVILGCTEITLLVKQADTDVALFDTTALHAQAIVDTMLKDTDPG